MFLVWRLIQICEVKTIFKLVLFEEDEQCKVIQWLLHIIIDMINLRKVRINLANDFRQKFWFVYCDTSAAEG